MPNDLRNILENDRRPFYSMTVVYLVYGLYKLEVDIHLQCNLRSVFHLIITFLVFVMWMLFTTVRLAELKLHRILGLLFLVPWIILAWTLNMEHSHKDLFALVLLLEIGRAHV